MLSSLVVTVIGPDRPGLVNLLSDCGTAHGASWEESRMANLAGQFAGMVRFAVDAKDADALAAALSGLEAHGLRVGIARGQAAAAPAAKAVNLELVGNDRPGIVREISHVLAEHGISIAELQTEVVSGAMSGGALFRMKALLQVPAALATDDLRHVLEALADELMVDIALDESAAK